MQLVVENSSEDLELHQLMKSEYFYKCPRKTCNYQYKTTVGEVTLTDYTEVEARIMQLGGLDATIPMMCTDRNGQRIRCNADIALARQLKEYLLEPTYLTLMGDGSWKKENNRWALTSLNVKTYKIDDSEEISDFSQLSDAAGSTWGQEKHPFHKLQIIQGKRADQ